MTVDVDVIALCLAFKAVCVALEIALSVSAVLSTLPRPTMDVEMPLTVPVKDGSANGAFDAIWFGMVVA